MPWVNLRKAEISFIMCSLPWLSSQAAGGMLAWSVSPRSSLERSLFLLEYQDRRLRYMMSKGRHLLAPIARQTKSQQFDFFKLIPKKKIQESCSLSSL